MIKSTKTDWSRLNQHNDKQIDYSDIANTDELFWEDAEIVSPHKKVDFTIMIDEDLAIWLKAMGNSSNIAVNNIIRAYFIVNT
jgi:uncharacterized protein (DUF4415 family)